MPEIENLSILSTLIIVLELQRTLSFEGQIHWKITIFAQKETYISLFESLFYSEDTYIFWIYNKSLAFKLCEIIIDRFIYGKQFH